MHGAKKNNKNGLTARKVWSFFNNFHKFYKIRLDTRSCRLILLNKDIGKLRIRQFSEDYIKMRKMGTCAMILKNSEEKFLKKSMNFRAGFSAM